MPLIILCYHSSASNNLTRLFDCIVPAIKSFVKKFQSDESLNPLRKICAALRGTNSFQSFFVHLLLAWSDNIPFEYEEFFHFFLARVMFYSTSLCWKLPLFLLPSLFIKILFNLVNIQIFNTLNILLYIEGILPAWRYFLSIILERTWDHCLLLNYFVRVVVLLHLITIIIDVADSQLDLAASLWEQWEPNVVRWVVITD